MKNINCKIIDRYTLQLLEDAYKGDIIDLKKLQTIDDSYILDALNKGKDDVYNNKIKEYKIKEETNNEKIRLEYEKKLKEEYEKTISTLNEEIINLKNKLENNEKEKESAIELTKSNIQKENIQKISQANAEIESLKQKIESIELNKKLEIQNETNNIKNTYEDEITNLNKKLAELKYQKEIEIQKKLDEQRKDYDKKTEELNNKLLTTKEEYNKLSLSKAILNNKQIGEELEQWAFSEYKAYSIAGFDNCSFEKANAVKEDEIDPSKQKPDFIFKVFLDNTKKDLITSVCLEMKNESNVSKTSNRHKNSDFYAKLDSDRRKNNCKFALLVSELEWNSTNDSPIVKINDYEDMYMVRPMYMMTFLSLIKSLSDKYALIILEKKQEHEQFEEVESIKNEFNKLKETYLENPLIALEKEIGNIKSKAKSIYKAADEITNLCEKIIADNIENIKKKIDRFDIVKLTRKIEKISK